MTAPSLKDLYPPVPWFGPGSDDMRHWRLDLECDGTQFSAGPADFLAVPEFESKQWFDLAPRPARRCGGGFSVVLDADCPAVLTLRGMLLREGTHCTGALLSLEKEDEGSSSFCVARARLERMRSEAGAARLDFSFDYPNADRAVCRLASRIDEFRDVPPQTWMPQVFGRCLYESPRLFTARVSRLERGLGPDHGVLELEDTVDWPPRGTVQVNDERIGYDTISPDGRVLGTEVSPLRRSDPRQHRRRSLVALVPDAGFRWAVADHAAHVHRVLAGSDSGFPVTNQIAKQVEAGGRVVTLLERNTLPLEIRHGRSAEEKETPRESRFWRLLEETNVYNPLDAFTAQDPAQGAVLTEERPLLAARFHQDASREFDRFDVLERAVLSFEFSDTPGWGGSTRLRVTITQGAREETFLVDREGRVADVPVDAEVVVPEQATQFLTKTVRHHFHRLESSSGWANAEQAITLNFENTTDYTGATKGRLSASFAAAPPELQGRIQKALFSVSVRNDNAQPVNVWLRALVPSLFSGSEVFTVPAKSTRICSFSLPLPGDVEGEDLFRLDAVYTFETDGESAVEAMWLDVEQVVPSPRSSLSTQRLPIQGRVKVRVPYNRVVFDVAEFLDPEDPWSFFHGEDPVELRIELVDPPPIHLWDVAVRDVHWRHTVFPATSVSLEDRLWVDAEGRLAESDGAANPVNVLRDLLVDSDFGATPYIAEETFNASSGAAALRGVRFAAVFQNSMPLGEIMARAAAESTFSLVQSGGRWRIARTPLRIDREELPELNADDRLEHISIEELRPSAAVLHPVSIMSGERLSRFTDAMSPLEPIETTWQRRGQEALARCVADRARPALSLRTFACAAKWLVMPAGSGIALPLSSGGVSAYQGEVSRIALSEGRITFDTVYTDRIETLFQVSPWSIQRNGTAGSLSFLADGKAVAELTADGRLLIAGDVREGTRPVHQGSSVIEVITGPVELVVSYTSGASPVSTFGLTTGGDLGTSLPIRENAELAQPAPIDAADSTPQGVLMGGMSGGAAALRLGESHLEIRGTISTNQIL